MAEQYFTMASSTGTGCQIAVSAVNPMNGVQTASTMAVQYFPDGPIYAGPGTPKGITEQPVWGAGKNARTSC